MFAFVKMQASFYKPRFVSVVISFFEYVIFVLSPSFYMFHVKHFYCGVVFVFCFFARENNNNITVILRAVEKLNNLQKLTIYAAFVVEILVENSVEKNWKS